MALLLVLGNTNPITFANSILAAVGWAKNKNDPVTEIHVVHSEESFDVLLGTRKADWLSAVSQHVPVHGLVHRTVEMNEQGQTNVLAFSKAAEAFARTSAEGRRMVDLSNGTTAQRVVASSVAYVLGFSNQFVLDFNVLRTTPGFVPDKIAEMGALVGSYGAVPPLREFDILGRIELNEVLRHRDLTSEMISRLSATIGKDREREHRVQLEATLEAIQHAQELRFLGEKTLRDSHFTAAVRELSVAFESIVRVLAGSCGIQADSIRGLHQVLTRIESQFENAGGDPEGAALLGSLNNLLRQIRNSAAHNSRLDRNRARLGLALILPAIDYLIEAVYPVVTKGSPVDTVTISEVALDDGSPQHGFVGIDGDDTGKELERMFAQNADSTRFRDHSKKVENAIKAVWKQASKLPDKELVFMAGDDLLFRATFTAAQILELQKVYSDTAQGGRTCSIGFGATPREAYIALKMAKARDGKAAIVGVRTEPPA